MSSHETELIPTLQLSNVQRTALSGDIAMPGEPAYEAACRLFNGAVHHRQAAVASCQGPDDITAAPRLAPHHGLPVSSHGG